MKFDTAAFVVFTVKASTPFVMLPSKEDTPTNNVNAIPSAHTTELLKNFESLSIWIFDDTFDIMFNATDISAIGIKTMFMKFPINVIMNNIIGCNIPADAMFPVDTMSVISKGISEFENATRLSIESFTIDIMSEKFFIITVTINMYVT